MKSYPGIALDIGSDLEIRTEMKKFIEMQTKEMKKLIEEISKEHYEITDGIDGNLNYLWYMYHKGTKSGEYRPFIYMAELMLLKKFGYINESELRNIINMMNSEDKDNLTMVTMIITNLRNLRVKDHGLYAKDNKAYKP